jgi:hypothetical protein
MLRRANILLFLSAILLSGCASHSVFSDPIEVAEGMFESLLKAETTIDDVERILGEPQISGGITDVTDDGLPIDRSRFDYVLTLRSASSRRVVFVSFWFIEKQLEAVFVRDPKSLRNLEQLFPRNVARKPNQALQPTRMLVTFRAYARPAPSTRVADL